MAAENWICKFTRPHGAILRLIAVLAIILSASALHSGCAGLSFRYGATITILHVNDVYEVAASGEGLGGLARVKTIVDNARAADPSSLLILSGDILSPSLLSTLDKGRHMIEAFNLMKADYATFGNHDFDFGIKALNSRISESKFNWVSSNVLDRGGRLPGTLYTEVKKVHRVNVGFFALLAPDTIDAYYLPKGIDILQTADAARQAINALRLKNAEVIIAITHMDTASDVELARQVPGIDLILGGHDHMIVNDKSSGTVIVKSGVNASHVGIVKIETRGGEVYNIVATHEPVSASLPEDGEMARMISNFHQTLDKSLLNEVAKISVPLDATSINNRSGETNLGNLISGAMSQTMVSDMAIINGGAIRGDKIIGPGTLSRGELISILPFENVLCKVRVMGHVIKQALEHSFAGYEKRKGSFLQISGAEVVADVSRPAGDRVTQVLIKGAPLEPGRVYTVALNDFILRGGDGYSMFDNAEILIGPLDGELLVNSLEKAFSSMKSLQSTVDGRIKIVGAGSDRKQGGGF